MPETIAPTWLSFQELVDGQKSLDDMSRVHRVERGCFLDRLGRPEGGLMLFNGDATADPWWEMQAAYVGGYFQAALLVGQAALENLLGGLIATLEEVPRTAGLAYLLKRADALGMTRPDELAAFETARRCRNPHAHFRPVTDHDGGVMPHALATNVEAEQLRKQDCEHFLVAIFAFVNRQCGLGPIRYADELPPGHPNQLVLALDR